MLAVDGPIPAESAGIRTVHGPVGNIQLLTVRLKKLSSWVEIGDQWPNPIRCSHCSAIQTAAGAIASRGDFSIHSVRQAHTLYSFLSFNWWKERKLLDSPINSVDGGIPPVQWSYCTLPAGNSAGY